MPDSVPDAFTPEFFRKESKLRQWSAFVRDLSGEIPSFETIVAEVAAFVGPATDKARRLLETEYSGSGKLPKPG